MQPSDILIVEGSVPLCLSVAAATACTVSRTSTAWNLRGCLSSDLSNNELAQRDTHGWFCRPLWRTACRTRTSALPLNRALAAPLSLFTMSDKVR